jgi:hypothetical protein
MSAACGCLMNGRESAILAAICVLALAPAFAGDANSPAFTPRQMAHCVMKRVRSNAAESYRDAFKACKIQFDSMRSEGPTDSAMTAATQPENPKR